MIFRTAGHLLRDTWRGWNYDRGTLQAAALAYYAIFSIAPLLILVIAVAGFFFGAEAVRGEIALQLQSLLGADGAKAVQGLIESAYNEDSSGLSMLIGLGLLLFGATSVFMHLESSLNAIWNVERKDADGFSSFFTKRLWSFAMVLVVGFLLMISLVLSAALAAAGKYMGGGDESRTWVPLILSNALSLIVFTILFGAIFRILPDIRIAWKDVMVGAAFTAFLFVLGKFAIGLYLGRSGIASVYGAAGSLVVVLVWIYYSAQIFFVGAEFTQVYAERCGTLTARPESEKKSEKVRENVEAEAERAAELEAPPPVEDGT